MWRDHANAILISDESEGLLEFTALTKAIVLMKLCRHAVGAEYIGMEGLNCIGSISK